MKRYFAFLLFIHITHCLYAQNNTWEREIHGFLMDADTRKPIIGIVNVFNEKDKYVQGVNSGTDGQFYLLINAPGKYKLTHFVSLCKTDTVYLNITLESPEVQDVYFYTREEDPACTKQLPKYDIEFVPLAALSCGWRPIAEFSLALRFRRNNKIFDRSHSLAPGIEWNFGFQKPLVGLKFGYTFLHTCFDYSGYTIGASGVYFFDRDGAGYYLQPQIGFEVVEIFDLFARYNIPIEDVSIASRLNKLSFGLRMWMR